MRIPKNDPAAAQTPWLIKRTGPRSHSCHEFATRSQSESARRQSRSLLRISTPATTPPMTSPIACIPVVRQLIAIAAASTQANPVPYAAAAIITHTT